MKAISRSLLVLGLTSVLALSACGGNQNACAVPMSLPMPAPNPAPKPPAPKPPVYRAPAPAAPKPAAPKPAAPKPVPKPVQKPYVPPKPLPIYRPTYRQPDPRMNRSSPNYDYRTVYVQHRTDHTPLLMLMAMNGMFSSDQPIQECEPR